MFRLNSTVLALVLCLACHRTKDGAVTIVPKTAETRPDAVPEDPFGSASPAYERLREVTEAALAMPWNGALDDFGPWLEEQTVAVERALSLLKAIRVGPLDVYAVANGRIALVYEHIASALGEASAAAELESVDPEWKGQEGRIWAQANAFWARCVRSCATAGTHVDPWDLRCREGLANTETKTSPYAESESPRQPK